MHISTPKKLPSGKWFIQMRLGGESIPVTESTEKRCKATARILKSEYLAGKRRRFNLSTRTLGDAIDDYIASFEDSLSPPTIRGYVTMRNNRFKDYMNTPLSKIDNWQKVIDDEKKKIFPTKTNPVKKLSGKTICNAWELVVPVLKKENIKVPKVNLPQKISKKTKWIEPESIGIFLSAIKNTKYEVSILLSLHSLRCSEMLYTIRSWDNFDLANGIIKVQGSVVPNKKHKLVEKDTTKTEDSRRDIKIMIPRLKVLLNEYKAKNQPITIPNSGTLRNHINKICRENDLPKVGIQGLRKTICSLGWHLGLSEREIMDIGGWKNIQTVHKHYLEIAKSDRLKADNALSDFFADS